MPNLQCESRRRAEKKQEFPCKLILQSVDSLITVSIHWTRNLLIVEEALDGRATAYRVQKKLG